MTGISIARSLEVGNEERDALESITHATNIWIAVRSVLQSRPESLERMLAISQVINEAVALTVAWPIMVQQLKTSTVFKPGVSTKAQRRVMPVMKPMNSGRWKADTLPESRSMATAPAVTKSENNIALAVVLKVLMRLG